MKFLHAADLHLDTPFQGLTNLTPTLQQRLLTAPLVALRRLTDLAIDEAVDFVLLVGDLFDQQGQSVQAQAALMTALERLNTAQIPVVLSFGNHDFQPDLNSWHFPANVHVFGPQVTTVTLTTNAQERVAISGFSYTKRWVTTPMVASYPLKMSAVDYQIGTLHGQTGTTGDHYAPFNVTDLLSKHYDYWALGHIHHRQLLNTQPPVVYAGNIQGRHRGETGAKGCIIVTSQADQTLKPEFKTLTDIEWVNFTADLTGTLDREDLLVALTEQLTTQFITGLSLVSITLPAAVQLTAHGAQVLASGGLLRQLQARADQHWWPVIIERATTVTAASLGGLDPAVWQQTGETVVTTTAITELAANLLNEDFLTAALLEETSPEQWRQRVLDLLSAQYHLTTGEDQHAD